MIEKKNQQKVIDANNKAQKDAQDVAFKREARRKALSTAQYVQENNTADKIIEDADKFYQWLIN